MGTPRVGEIYLPIPHPGDMCSAQENQQSAKKELTHGNNTVKLHGEHTPAPPTTG